MSTVTSPVHTAFDVEKIREDFPVLKQTIHGQPLVYLDNAATAQKPHAVIDAIVKFYEVDCANIHRGVHELSQRSTKAYEQTRAKVKRFLNARATEEIVFVRGTTEGINLVTQSWGRQNVKAGDEIIIAGLEHHSNIVPWQMLCEEKGAILRVIPIDDRGELMLDEYEKLLEPAHAHGRHRPRLERARHHQPRAARSSRWRTPRARWRWSMARRPCRT